MGHEVGNQDGEGGGLTLPDISGDRIEGYGHPASPSARKGLILNPEDFHEIDISDDSETKGLLAQPEVDVTETETFSSSGFREREHPELEGSGNLPYDHPSHFSAHASRLAHQQAHLKALCLAGELRAEEELEKGQDLKPTGGDGPLEVLRKKLSSLSFSVSGSFNEKKAGEYHLLSPSSTSPPGDIEEELEIAVAASHEANGEKVVQMVKLPLPPALRSTSLYGEESAEGTCKSKRKLQFAESESDPELTNDSEGERKKMIRRLTPAQKKELYELRPDLHITPNWAQKYREELREQQASRSSTSLTLFLLTLLLILLIFIIFYIIFST